VIALGVLVLSLVAAVAATGHRYYAASALAPALFAADLPDDRLFSSSGRIGVTCGMAGASLFGLNLLYLVRKRLRLLGRAGSMRSWLDCHVLGGLLGCLMVALHAGLATRTLVGKTCVWSLGVVVATGIFGRYLVRFVPRADGASRVPLSAVEDRVLALIEEVRPLVKDDPVAISILQQVAEAAATPASGAATGGLWEALREGRRTRREALYLVQAATLGAPSGGARSRRRLRRRIMSSCRQVSLVHLSARFLETWRVFHCVLALLCLSVLALHVFAAYHFGFVRP